MPLIKSYAQPNKKVFIAISLVSAVIGMFTVAGSFAASGSTPAPRHGNIMVTAYRKIGSEAHAQRLPGVKIHLSQSCEGNPGNDAVTRDTGNGDPNNGTVYYKDCVVNRYTNVSSYTISVTDIPPDYHMADDRSKTISVHWAGEVGQAELSFILEHDAVSGNPAPPTPAHPVTPPVVKDPVPGSIQVTSYVRKPDGSLDRIGNMEVHTQAKDHDTKDTAHNCDPYNKTTNSDHGSSGYGQATFPNCWSGPTGTKPYIFSQLIIPAGYTFRSIHTTEEGELRQDGYFNVHSGKETAVSIWVDKVDLSAQPGGDTPAPGSTAPNGGTVAPSTGTTSPQHQVVGKHEIAEQVQNRTPSASNTAGQSNNTLVVGEDGLSDADSLGEDGLDDSLITDDDLSDAGLTDDLTDDPDGGLDGGDGGDGGDPSATSDSENPSTPANMWAKELSPGIITLSWSSSTDNIQVGNYVLERSTDRNTWDVVGDSITDTDYTDTSLEYGKLYYYRVSAEDSSGNLSEAAVTSITTQPFTPNVDNGNLRTDPVRSADGDVNVDIPDSAAPDDMSCSVYNDDDSGDDDLPTDLAYGGGPYNLACKDASGDDVNDFDSPISVEVEFDGNEDFDANNLGDAGLYELTDSGWEEVGKLSDGEGTVVPNNDGTGGTHQVSKKDGKVVVTMKTKQPKLFAVLSSHNAKTPWAVFGLGLFLISAVPLLALGVFKYVPDMLRPRYREPGIHPEPADFYEGKSKPGDRKGQG
jgi:hypothetical protein